MGLEAKVKKLETLLETVSHENSMAVSRMRRLEAKLFYYGCLLSSTADQRNDFIASHRNGESRVAASQYTHGGEVEMFGGVQAYSYAPSIPSLMTPALASDYQRVQSYNSSSSGSYSPTREPLLEYSRPPDDPRMSQGEKVVSLMGAYLPFNKARALEDGLYQELNC